MFVSRHSAQLRLATLAFMAAAMTMFTGLIAPPAHAGLERFWEQSEVHGKTASMRKASYRRSAYGKPRHAKRKKLGGYAAAIEPRRKTNKGVRVAALGNTYFPEPKAQASLSGSVQWTASAGCLDTSLRAIVDQVAANFGRVRVNSTCRSHSHNRAVGGARRSKHLSGDAVDFRVYGNTRAVYAYLKSNGNVGGLKHYGGGLFHIDNGARRSW